MWITKPLEGSIMQFIKVTPDNHGKILRRCRDIDRDFLNQFEKDNTGESYFVAFYWVDSNHKIHSHSLFFTEDTIDKEFDFPYGKYNDKWFAVRRKYTSNN